MRTFILFGIVLGALNSGAQGVFEDAVGSESAGEEKNWEIGGSVRGVLYGGRVQDENEAEIKSSYGEAALSIDARRRPWGSGFAEIRFRSGYELNAAVAEIDLREAYVTTYIGPLDFRFGKQIVVWGRADGFNPTNNLTPERMLVFSPDIDDRRVANIAVRSYINLSPVRVELIWVPLYKASEVPIEKIPFSLDPGALSFELPEPLARMGFSMDRIARRVEVAFGPGRFPDANIKNSSGALKCDLRFSSIEGSVSYYNGYHPQHGFDAEVAIDTLCGEVDETQGGGAAAALPFCIPESLGIEIMMIPAAYRVHIGGADFSSTIGSLFGIRGEVAFRYPDEDYTKHSYIPNPDLSYVAGLDKTIGDLSLLAQYTGRYVIDYSVSDKREMEMTDILGYIEGTVRDSIAIRNRLFFSQDHEWRHGVSWRLGWSLLHETLILELAGMYSVTTEDLVVRPRVEYDIADALTVTAGGDLYTGADGALFDYMQDILSAGYVQMRISF
jgi:hypothetical protein